MSGAGSGETVIRAYRPGDETALNVAFNRAFGLDRSLAEWAWKFPAQAGGRDFIQLGLDDGEIVAHFAAQPTNVQVDGRRLLAGHAVDAFSRPRGGLARRGLYARTVERFYAECGGAGGAAFLFGFPGARHLRLGRRLLGYEEPVPVAVFRHPRLAASPPLARALAVRLAERLLRRVVSAEENAATADRLWARAASRYPVAVVRDGVRWRRRYSGRPGVTYHRRTIWRHGEPRASGVFRVEAELLRWADLVWDGSSERDLVALAVALEAAGHELGAGSGELWLGGDARAAAVLARRGWQRERHPQDLHLTAVSLTAGLEVDSLPPRFYVTLGDSDLV